MLAEDICQIFHYKAKEQMKVLKVHKLEANLRYQALDRHRNSGRYGLP